MHRMSGTTFGDSVHSDPIRLPPHSVAATGILKNYNTIEDFKAADKAALFNQLADEVLSGIPSSDRKSSHSFDLDVG